MANPLTKSRHIDIRTDKGPTETAAKLPNFFYLVINFTFEFEEIGGEEPGALGEPPEQGADADLLLTHLSSIKYIYNIYLYYMSFLGKPIDY